MDFNPNAALTGRRAAGCTAPKPRLPGANIGGRLQPLAGQFLAGTPVRIAKNIDASPASYAPAKSTWESKAKSCGLFCRDFWSPSRPMFGAIRFDPRFHLRAIFEPVDRGRCFAI